MPSRHKMTAARICLAFLLAVVFSGCSGSDDEPPGTAGWQALDPARLGLDVQPHLIAAADWGFVAAGTDTGSGRNAAWWSSNGESWDAGNLSDVTAALGGTTLIFGIAAQGNRAVILGQTIGAAPVSGQPERIPGQVFTDPEPGPQAVLFETRDGKAWTARPGPLAVRGQQFGSHSGDYPTVAVDGGRTIVVWSGDLWVADASGSDWRQPQINLGSGCHPGEIRGGKEPFVTARCAYGGDNLSLIGTFDQGRTAVEPSAGFVPQVPLTGAAIDGDTMIVMGWQFRSTLPKPGEPYIQPSFDIDEDSPGDIGDYGHPAEDPISDDPLDTGCLGGEGSGDGAAAPAATANGPDVKEDSCAAAVTYSVSTDRGATWTPPREFGIPTGAGVSFARGMALVDGRLVVTGYADNGQGSSAPAVWTSDDHGSMWTGTALLNGMVGDPIVTTARHAGRTITLLSGFSGDEASFVTDFVVPDAVASPATQKFVIEPEPSTSPSAGLLPTPSDAATADRQESSGKPQPTFELRPGVWAGTIGAADTTHQLVLNLTSAPSAGSPAGSFAVNHPDGCAGTLTWAGGSKITATPAAGTSSDWCPTELTLSRPSGVNPRLPVKGPGGLTGLLLPSGP